MKIPGIPARITPASPTDLSETTGKPAKTGEVRFSDQLKELFYAVNDKQAVATEKVGEVITGESNDLHNAMIALEEANVSFQLMLEVRNKMLEAYQEINRMNI